ncbi:MAG TPA: isochorismatase family protein [Ilumatobacter sp.]|nr:isochorismatase family protein [Ilumatobacter sp.]
MATVREGDQSVLLVVDLQVGVVANVWEGDRVVANAAAAVDQARRAGVPVVWVQHADDELVSGSPEWALAPELVPADGEPVVHKHFNSSWEQTELAELLAGLGATRIVLTGCATNWCIRATAYGAFERGYDVTLVKDAHTTESMEFEDGHVIPASHLIDDLNVAVRWLSYPGLTNTTVATAELDFTPATEAG